MLGAERSNLILAAGLVLALSVAPSLLAVPHAAPPGPAGHAAQASAPRTERTVVVEGNPQLFATLCALYAAGFQAEASAAGFHPLRARLRAELLRLKGPAAEALRAYYREHSLSDPTATLSRYVSFALVSGPPPGFSYKLRHDDLPPDVLPIEGFTEVLANFYHEAQLDRLWAQVEPEYDRESARLQGPVTHLVMTSTAYLREFLQPYSPRTFAVYVEPLVGGRTNFRNYGDHYAIVLSPGGQIPLDDIRHAFLHFLLDPLPIRSRSATAEMRPLRDLAARAPRLPAAYQEDLPAFVGECLVRAVELRLRRLSPEKLAAAVDEAERDGYVLVRAFSRELARFEKAEPAMNFYFPELMRAVNVAEETKRLQTVAFTTAATPGAAAPGADGAKFAPAGEDSELAATLAEGERQIAAQNAEAAVGAFQRVLAKYPDQPRALYGLAVAAVLQGEVEHAKELFQRLVANPSRSDAHLPGKDALILAWSHVYLGRIYDVDRYRDLALSEYRAALAVEGAPEPARVAARRGIERGYEPTTQNRP